MVRKLFSKQGLWVWAPVALTALLVAGASDAARGVRATGRRAGGQQLFQAVGSSLGIGGSLAIGGVATAIGGAIFVLRARRAE